MDAFDIQSAIDKLLDAHVQGRRNAYTTHESLRALFEGLRLHGEVEAFKTALFSRFLLELRIGKRPDTSGVSTRPEPAAILASELLKAGPEQTRTLALLLSHIDLKDEKALPLWTTEILPEFNRAMRLGQLSPESVTYLESILMMYSASRRNSAFFVPSQLSVSVDQIMDSIEENRLSDFEDSLKKRAAKTQDGQPLHVKQDHVPSQFRQALQEASTYLSGTGLFDPKKAADLIRTCIDETHRDLVGKLPQIIGKPFAGQDKDGVRRTYLREAGLYSQAEETFFSSLYTLLSGAASHVLITRRDTIVIMAFTVESYIDALYRRFEELKIQYNAIKP
jgi:hypothetical protein